MQWPIEINSGRGGERERGGDEREKTRKRECGLFTAPRLHLFVSALGVHSCFACAHLYLILASVSQGTVCSEGRSARWLAVGRWLVCSSPSVLMVGLGWFATRLCIFPFFLFISLWKIPKGPSKQAQPPVIPNPQAQACLDWTSSPVYMFSKVPVSLQTRQDEASNRTCGQRQILQPHSSPRFDVPTLRTYYLAGEW